ncbi:MAG: hypothetical protein QOG55_3825 [Acidobacteriaceae bacterium]|jgi:hypothetical protein|nr:hypothetical protein [Acidobacteriaceae bacterium]
MLDGIFIAGTALFFTLAIVYVRGCELLGKGRSHERS